MGLFSKPEAEEVEILGNPLRCEIYHYNKFFQREGKIQTTGLTFFDLDWLNASATCVVCERCGYVHWFLPPAGGGVGS